MLFQPHCELPRTFVQHSYEKLNTTWILIDPEGNKHRVVFNKSLENPSITDSRSGLRDFYKLTGYHNCIFHYLGESLFELNICS